MSSLPPRSAFVRLGRLLLVLGVCLSLGLHLAALQAVAWTGMLVSYSQSEGIGAALRDTFDGKHPCKLCRMVEKEKERAPEKDPQGGAMFKELKAVLPTQNVVANRAADTIDFPSVSNWAPGYGQQPPVPPPRV